MKNNSDILLTLTVFRIRSTQDGWIPWPENNRCPNSTPVSGGSRIHPVDRRYPLLPMRGRRQQ
jgi:hypothetical protein